MTGIREAFREFFLAMKYDYRQGIVLILFLIISGVSGPFFFLCLFMGLLWTTTYFCPDSPIDFLLPLSEDELRSKYLSHAWVKVISAILFLFLNFSVGIPVNLWSYRERLLSEPIIIGVFFILTIVHILFYCLTTMNSSLRASGFLYFEQKRNVPVILGRIGIVLYGIALLVVMTCLDEASSFLNPIPVFSLILIDAIFLLVGIVGLLKDWKKTK